MTPDDPVSAAIELLDTYMPHDPTGMADDYVLHIPLNSLREAIVLLRATQQAVDVEKCRQWTLYECDNCKAMYLENPGGVCYCNLSDNKFTKRVLVDKDHLHATGRLK